MTMEPLLRHTLLCFSILFMTFSVLNALAFLLYRPHHFRTTVHTLMIGIPLILIVTL